MQFIDLILGKPLGFAMYFCYKWVHNYGLTILLFTVIAKLVMFPISLLLQKNSIKMVKLQPELNQIKRLYAGDRERVNDEEYKLYEREGYNPLLGLLPTFLQIIIVLGLIQVVYHPLEHLFHLEPSIIGTLLEKTGELLGAPLRGNAAQLQVIETIQDPVFTDTFKGLGIVNESVFTEIQSLNMRFLGINLAETPKLTTLSPVLWIALASGLSALLLCVVQNRINVLQREQGKINKIGTTIFLVAFGFYFAFLVPGAIGLYWVFSNLLSILVLYLQNWVIDPRKYIDYENRAAQNGGAAEADEIVAARRDAEKILEERSEKDIDRFENTTNKLLVIYSEKSGFYQYFATVIEYILSHTNIIIHYLTGDPNDAIFQNNDPKIAKYFVAEKHLGRVFAGMDASVVLLTMPDLNTFHIKRSIVRKNIEYVYIFHAMMSTNMAYRKAAFDHFDTILCVGPYQKAEIRETETMYGLKPKKLIEAGYGALDLLMQERAEQQKSGISERPGAPCVLIAPSHQPENIMESCLDEIITSLKDSDYKITVRPHPQWVRRNPEKMQEIRSRYANIPENNLSFETDFTSHTSVMTADLLITDWSGTAFEYCFVTGHPAVFVNTPMKIINPEYSKYVNKPIEITFRTIAGKTIDPEDIPSRLPNLVKQLLLSQNSYSEAIDEFLKTNFYNLGNSGKIGGKYIISAIKEHARRN